MAERNQQRVVGAKPAWIFPSLLVLVGLVGLALVAYRPDRPVATIVPGSSPGPAFVVQIIRPRAGLPLGGVLPPGLFGLETHLGFDSASSGASFLGDDPGRLEFGADDWRLVLVFDADGRVSSETHVDLELIFQERVRRVRCRPGDPAVGTQSSRVLDESGTLSGSFDIELLHCEDASTGQSIGWPPKPLILHGSYDQLQLERNVMPLGSQPNATQGNTLVGQILLPSGLGSRGVELTLMIAASEAEPLKDWVLFDEQGRFAHNFRGSLISLQVTAGAEVHRIEGKQLPKVDSSGQIDVKSIDLRQRLTQRSFWLRAAEGQAEGQVRVGMWFGLPPVGPSGESVSLGSRQFPPVALGSAVSWLLPNDAHSVYFLVERPSRLAPEPEWRGGYQRLFGPYSSIAFPDELLMD